MTRHAVAVAAGLRGIRRPPRNRSRALAARAARRVRIRSAPCPRSRSPGRARVSAAWRSPNGWVDPWPACLDGSFCRRGSWITDRVDLPLAAALKWLHSINARRSRSQPATYPTRRLRGQRMSASTRSERPALRASPKANRCRTGAFTGAHRPLEHERPHVYGAKRSTATGIRKRSPVAL